ncbi:MAG: hypothetical protein R2757_13550 [Draconibacterium sp.]
MHLRKQGCLETMVSAVAVREWREIMKGKSSLINELVNNDLDKITFQQ